MLAMEASDPDFLGPRILKFWKYWPGKRPSPFAMHRCTKKFRSFPYLESVLSASGNSWRCGRAARTLYTLLLAADSLFLVACPLPLRVDGDATVAPLHGACACSPKWRGS